jgi:hypothetical protein
MAANRGGAANAPSRLIAEIARAPEKGAQSPGTANRTIPDRRNPRVPSSTERENRRQPPAVV